jgi:hypothetical protein
MEELRAFLEFNSEELSKDEVCVPLFAFPYIHDPSTHPTYKKIFTVSSKPTSRFTFTSRIPEFSIFSKAYATFGP